MGRGVLMPMEHGALLLQIRITVLLSSYVLQNYRFNCFTVGCVGWREVLVSNKFSAELLLSSDYIVEQTGVTALHCNPGHLYTCDPASAQAAGQAPAGLSPRLPQNITHIFTQCLAFVSSLTETKFPSSSSMTEFPQFLSLGLYSSQDFDITTKQSSHLSSCNQLFAFPTL